MLLVAFSRRIFCFSSRRRHTSSLCDWSSDVCSSDLNTPPVSPRGFIGAGKLEEYSARVVFRHEHTLSGPKADRLELLRHTKTHTGQLFMLYSDPQRRIHAILAEAEEAAAPATEMRDECGVLHRLWVIAE